MGTSPTAATDAQWRMFVAVPLPEPLRAPAAELLAACRERAQALGLQVRWTPAHNLHFTLQFLGDVAATRGGELAAALAPVGRAHSAFSLALGEAGAFPSWRRPRVIWIGLAEAAARAMGALATSVRGVLTELGFSVERRAYQAHLTLGRVKEARSGPAEASSSSLSSWLDTRLASGALASPAGSLPRVGAFQLFRSELLPGGARHSVVSEIALNPTAGG